MSLGSSLLRFALRQRRDFHSPDECFFINIVFSLYRSLTSTSVLFMALERYITILKPLTHCYILTERRIRLSLAASWAISFAFVAALVGLRVAYPDPVREDKCDINNDFQVWKVNLTQISIDALVYAAVIVIYIHLHVIARRHLRVIERERRFFGLVQFQRNLKRTSVAFRITLFLLALEVPLFALNLLRTFASDRQELTRYSDYMFFLSLLRQLLQPAFYTLFSSDFRKSLLLLVCRNRVAPAAQGRPPIDIPTNFAAGRRAPKDLAAPAGDAAEGDIQLPGPNRKAQGVWVEGNQGLGGDGTGTSFSSA